MKTSQCDLTMNFPFSSLEKLLEYLRIFKKGLLVPHYKHVSFHKNDQEVKNWRTASDHSHCLSCKSANFLIYGKIAQLEMIGRCDEALMDKHLLRYEAELKRSALKKHLGKAAMATNQGILLAAAKQTQIVIQWYLDRLTKAPLTDIHSIPVSGGEVVLNY